MAMNGGYRQGSLTEILQRFSNIVAKFIDLIII